MTINSTQQAHLIGTGNIPITMETPEGRLYVVRTLRAKMTPEKPAAQVYM